MRYETHDISKRMARPTKGPNKLIVVSTTMHPTHEAAIIRCVDKTGGALKRSEVTRLAVVAGLPTVERLVERWAPGTPEALRVKEWLKLSEEIGLLPVVRDGEKPGAPGAAGDGSGATPEERVRRGWDSNPCSSTGLCDASEGAIFAPSPTPAPAPPRRPPPASATLPAAA